MGFENLCSENGEPILNDALLYYVEKKGFEEPSPIQKIVVPLFIGNKDVAVEACTGSGKTLAYLLPIFVRLFRSQESQHQLRLLWLHSVIIAPTRELVQQIAEVAREVLTIIREFQPDALSHCAVIELYGGRKSSVDASQVHKASHPQSKGILVATPGRLKSQLMEGRESSLKRESHWSFKEVEMLIIDEADKLFGESNFLEQMAVCIACLPKQRRTGVFSATLTSETRALSKCGMRNPLIVKLAFEESTSHFENSIPEDSPSTTADTNTLLNKPSDASSDEDQANEGGLSDEDKASDNDAPSDGTCDEEEALSDVEQPEYDNGDINEGGLTQVFSTNEAEEEDDDVQITAHYMPIGLRNYFIHAEQDERIPILMRILENEDYHKVLVFTSSCASTDFTYMMLDAYYKPTSFAKIIRLHGKLERSQRQRALYEFGESERVKTEAGNVQKRVLVASDLAARGIDFQGIDLIVQLDAPGDPSQIFHRMGRTARAGGRGDTLLMLSRNEEAFLDMMRRKGVTFLTGFPLDESYQTSRSKLSDEGLRTTLPEPLPDDISSMREFVHTFIQNQLKLDRFVLEKAKDAFVSYVRSYKEHRLSFIFKFDDLDIGRTANRFGLFRIPFMKEFRLKGDQAAATDRWKNFITSTFDEKEIFFKNSEGAAKHEILLAQRKEKRELLRAKALELKNKRRAMIEAKKSASARRRRRREINFREMEEEIDDMALIKRRKRLIKKLRESGVKINKSFIVDDELGLETLTGKIDHGGADGSASD